MFFPSFLQILFKYWCRKCLWNNCIYNLKIVKKRYLKGKCSINGSLPIPTIHQLENYAYISTINIFLDLLGWITIRQNERNVSRILTSFKISQSQQSSEIYHSFSERFPNNSSVITIWINEWFDGMDLMDFIKNNRNSIWIKTINVAPPHKIRHKAYLYTYPIAICLKKSCHEEVEMKFVKDLEPLCKGTEVGKCYSARHKRSIILHAELFASLQDQPERRVANYISLGNSTFTSCFG